MTSKRLLDGGGVVGFISFHQLVQPLHLVVLGLHTDLSCLIPNWAVQPSQILLKLSNLALPLHSFSVLSCWSITAVCLVAHAGIQQRKGRLTLHLEASNKPILSHETAYTAAAAIGNRYVLGPPCYYRPKNQPSSSCYLLHTSIP